MDLSALAEEIEMLISATIPKSTTVQKYGGTLFTLKPDEKEGQFCGVFLQKNNVQISFSNGAELKDPKNLLSGAGKKRRHINVADINDVSLAELKKLIRQAAKL